MREPHLVRPVDASAAAELAALHALSFPDFWSAETLEALLVRPHVQAFGVVVNPDGRLGGFILIQVIADEAEVLTFCVAPDLRGRKLGAALLLAAASSAASRGATQMFLEVSEANLPARHLYEQQGFVMIGRRAAYYQDEGRSRPGVDALVMRKSLHNGASSAN